MPLAGAAKVPATVQAEAELVELTEWDLASAPVRVKATGSAPAMAQVRGPASVRASGLVMETETGMELVQALRPASRRSFVRRSPRVRHARRRDSR